ncbi:hypothetical protein NBRC110019_11230 [Neptunitalea chrysea]|uniref:PDZ domain-containing protein n=1 Tax=Neptunitalea chrysea TaxID=1647581 RepID=A0A9W6EU34_9FLAO|nr:PDZ domain-containing protein [Neptunitalea chrysea]GLB52084.1 hypothetical protein NBRC110019_11230 [Neptunitalea chrysea]
MGCIVVGQPFEYQSTRSYEEFTFNTSGNLILLPVELNGVPMNFVLDSGVNKTVILNLTSTDSLLLNDLQEIYLTGIGSKEPFKVIYSENNTLSVGNLFDVHHELYIILEDTATFSKLLGVEVHGIMGYDILKDFVVEVDYARHIIRFYPHEKYKRRKKNKEAELPLAFYKRKPYIRTTVSLDTGVDEVVKLLLDTGSGDALWLFANDTIKVPDNYFMDHLGIGLSGDIIGQRTKINSLKISEDLLLNDVKCAFPEPEYLVHLSDDNFGRNGSLGGEALSRFLVTINYRDKWLRLKKNKNYKKEFYYNMSGITIQHNGMRIVQERIRNKIDPASSDISNSGASYTSYFKQQTQYYLTPKIEIAEIRTGSPAALVGVQKGDVILSINKRTVLKQSINEVRDMLNRKDGKTIKIVVDRNGDVLKFSFELKRLF